MGRTLAPLIRIRLFGGLEVEVDQRPVDIAGRRKRGLLSALALYPGRTLSADSLLSLIWGEEPPPSGRKALQVHMSELRTALRRQEATALVESIQTVERGYLLDVDPDAVDVHRFTSLLARAGDVDLDPDTSSPMVTDALALWTGPPVPELAEDAEVMADRHRLDLLRLGAEEALLANRISTGPDPADVDRAEALVAAEPYRERRTVLLMAALFGSARQADAIATYRRTADRLNNELGLAPGPELAAAELAVLRHDRVALGLPPSPGGDGKRSSPPAPPSSPAPAFTGASEVSAEAMAVVAAVMVLGQRATVTSVGAVTDLAGRELLAAIDVGIAEGRLSREGMRLSIPAGDGPAPEPPSSTLSALHLRAAQHLSQAPLPDRVADAEARALHLVSALPLGSVEAAGHACQRAGEVIAPADPEKAVWFHRQRRTLATTGAQRIDASLDEAECLIRSAGPAEEIDALTADAVEAAREAADGARLADAVLVRAQRRSAALGADPTLERNQVLALDLLGPEPSARGVRILADLAAALLLTDRRQERLAFAQRALEAAEALDDPFLRAEALTGMHQADWRCTNAQQRLAWAEQAAALALEARNPTQQTHTQLYLAHDRLELGQRRESLIALASAEATAERSGSTRYRWATLAWRAHGELMAGRFEEAERLGAAALDTWGDTPHDDALACWVAQAMTAALVQGHHRRATDLLTGAIAQNPALDVLRAMLAFALADEGDIDAAQRQLDALGPDPCPRADDPAWSLHLAMVIEAGVLLDQCRRGWRGRPSGCIRWRRTTS